MDGVIDEICRVRTPGDIKQSSLRRWQDYLRQEIQPKLDIYHELMTKAASGLPKAKRGADGTA